MNVWKKDKLGARYCCLGRIKMRFFLLTILCLTLSSCATNLKTFFKKKSHLAIVSLVDNQLIHYNSSYNDPRDQSKENQNVSAWNLSNQVTEIAKKILLENKSGVKQISSVHMNKVMTLENDSGFFTNSNILNRLSEANQKQLITYANNKGANTLLLIYPYSDYFYKENYESGLGTICGEEGLNLLVQIGVEVVKLKTNGNWKTLVHYDIPAYSKMQGVFPVDKLALDCLQKGSTQKQFQKSIHEKLTQGLKEIGFY